MRLLDRLDQELGDGAGLVAILDYDGTLTPLVASPGAATLAPSVRGTLARLAECEGERQHEGYDHEAPELVRVGEERRRRRRRPGFLRIE